MPLFVQSSRRIAQAIRACSGQSCMATIWKSDLDILVELTADTTMFDIGGSRHQLVELPGAQVEVLAPNALPDKFRGAILVEATAV